MVPFAQKPFHVIQKEFTKLHCFCFSFQLPDLKNKKAGLETSVQRAQRDVEKLAEPQVEEIVTRSCQSFHLQDVEKGPS